MLGIGLLCTVREEPGEGESGRLKEKMVKKVGRSQRVESKHVRRHEVNKLRQASYS